MKRRSLNGGLRARLRAGFDNLFHSGTVFTLYRQEDITGLIDGMVVFYITFLSKLSVESYQQM